LVQTPVLTTIHGFSSDRILPVYERYDGRTHYVAISEADRHARLDYVATIHHGILLSDFTLWETPGDYLLFFGRIHPDKGTAEAIEVARRAGRRLIIAGIIHDRDYFERQVVPHLDGDRVRYVGSVGAGARDALLGGAFALLHLSNFEEPFGLSTVEAMATGTPVIARGRGAVPEIVRHGETGFIVDTVDEAVRALDEIPALDRRRVRRHVEQHFSRDRMVDEYLRVYHEVLQPRVKGVVS
jgi:glycosyltransferase involved in cell wall biosynthesis